jgi:hypothetical protein
MQNAIAQVSSAIYLVAAYGRHYATKDQVLQDWMQGKDFKIHGGPYCSVRDLEAMRWDFSTIYLCYGNAQLLEV